MNSEFGYVCDIHFKVNDFRLCECECAFLKVFKYWTLMGPTVHHSAHGKIIFCGILPQMAVQVIFMLRKWISYTNTHTNFVSSLRYIPNNKRVRLFVCNIKCTQCAPPTEAERKKTYIYSMSNQQKYQRYGNVEGKKHRYRNVEFKLWQLHTHCSCIWAVRA